MEPAVGLEPTTCGLPARHSHLPGSNRGPLLYESIALPAELRWLWQAGDTAALPDELSRQLPAIYYHIVHNLKTIYN